MIKTIGRVLKSSEVKLEGRFHLDVTNPGSGLPKQKVAAAVPAQVSVVENHSEYAVIEVTCSCGTKMSVKCEYGGDESQVQGNIET